MNRIEAKSRYELDTDFVNRHYNTILYLTNRQVSWLTASIVVLAFCIFIAGYVLGQKKALEEYSSTGKGIFSSSYVQVEGNKNPLEDELSASLNHESASKQYYAQLIGFGTLRAADKFAERLQQKNFPVKVVEKHSKTAQGKKIIWYQVVTETFDKKDDLIVFTQKIEKEERLNDIRIVSC
jgi:hypothetical protein